MSLKELLESRKAIKLICGAGNEDIDSIAKTVSLYIKAGVRFFDASANVEVIRAIRSVLKKEGVEGYIQVSYGIKDDPHMGKMSIDLAKCTSCNVCTNTCLQKALVPSMVGMTVVKDRCIGCGICIPSCKYGAMSLVSEPKSIKDTLPELIAEGIDSVEFHIGPVGKEVEEKWKDITSIYKGIISICIDRSCRGDKELIKTIVSLIEGRDPYTTIIQADGFPMSGNSNAPSTTLQALATAQIVQRAKLPVYLMLSGGTNAYTTEFAQTFGIEYHGISLGSFARKGISGYLDKPDDGPSYVQAVMYSKGLILTTLSSMEA